MHNTNSQIKFKTTMLKSLLCNYSDAYIFVKGTISIANTTVTPAAANNIKNGNIQKLYPIYWLHKQNETKNT